MIKAAFFDIDGTLLSFKTHRVSEGTIRAFGRLHRAGVRTFISTGRPMVLIPPMPVDFDGHITMNGGLVFTPRETLLSNPIPQADTERWLDYAQKHNLCTMIFTVDSMLVTQVNAYATAIRDQLGFQMPPVVPIGEMRGLQAYQLIAVMPPAADDEVARLMPGCRLPRWCDAFTDIVAAGNSKAEGMAAICRHFGINRQDTLAFGDGANDIEMLRWAGTGVAMGNAADIVKQAADMVTLDVDNEGIEHAVNQILDR
ncbi:MAG: Cof-type HAD-IIB family hydrolase [Bacteroidales bacterium]|nr:Cof-type HAD-IIB family hydrolase [Bacteroidales bacterium]